MFTRLFNTDVGVGMMFGTTPFDLFIPKNNGMLAGVGMKAVKNPIITCADVNDRKALFVADPFLFILHSKLSNPWYTILCCLCYFFVSGCYFLYSLLLYFGPYSFLFLLKILGIFFSRCTQPRERLECLLAMIK